MRIERLETYGFQRLLHERVKHFVYTPSSAYQLILGTNGSGKSSILRELSPLPGHQSDYSKDGYKKVVCSHRGKTYRMESIFKNNKHSFFIDDGENLNPGGTQEVQRSLVWQHFGIDKDIHELLIGEVRLTQLSPAERRKWITRLSRADYDYPMNTFKKIASRARDQQGVLRHLKQRLVNETQTLIGLGGVEGLEDRANALRNELNHLMMDRQPNVRELEAITRELSELSNGVDQMCRDYFNNTIDTPQGYQFKSIDDVHLNLQQIDSRIQAEQALLDRAGNEYHDYESVINSVQVEAGYTADDLPGLIADQLRLLEELGKQTVVYHGLVSPSEIQRDWNIISPEVQSTFRELPDNSDRSFSREKLQATQNELQGFIRERDLHENKIRAINERLMLMREAQETQCPNCKYVWKPGYSEDEEVRLRQELSGRCQASESLGRMIADRELVIEESRHVQGLYNQFRGYIQGYPRLQPLWDHILQNQLLLNEPKNNLTLFQTWNKDLVVNVAIEEANRRLEHYREVQSKHSTFGDSAHMTRKMRSLQEEIEQRTSSVLRSRQERDIVQRYATRLLRLQNIAAEMERMGNRIELLNSSRLDALRNKVIDQTVHTHQNELAGIVRKISEKEGQEGIVRDLDNSRLQAESDSEVLNLLVKALSPNEGLIAEQLTGDIGCLVAQLNSVIGSIWTYDMEVLPCGIGSGELDYKFPVQFSTSDKRSPDIFKTSKGQRQAIDLAFQLTGMMYLDLVDFPLFLDEPGEGFDEEHRRKLMDFVKQLMDSNRHSQLFMISHYASGHGSFSNAETMVLDSSNISVPGVYNQHVVLT